MRVTRCSTYKWDVFNPSKPYITITPVIKWGVKFWIWIHRCIHRFHGTIMKTMAEGGPLPVVIKVLTPLIGVKWPQVPNYVLPFIIGAHLADEGFRDCPLQNVCNILLAVATEFLHDLGVFFFKENGSNEEMVACSPKNPNRCPAQAIYSRCGGTNWGGAEIPSCKWDILTPVNPRSPSP